VSVEVEEVSVELVSVVLEEVSVVAVVPEEVSGEVVSVEGVEVVSVVEALLAGVVSVLVVMTENESPNAPEAISPNANRTAKRTPIRKDRFLSVRRTLAVPCLALRRITPYPSP
jgi:hypothetical protein